MPELVTQQERGQMIAAGTQGAEHRRALIHLPGGRSISGFLAGHAGKRGGESMDLFLARQRGCPESETVQEYRLRDDLARQLGGLTEVRMPLGFADVATDRAVFEVEPHHSWQMGARQVLAYAAQCGLPPALALFRAIPEAKMLGIFNRLRAINLHGLCRSKFIDLWWWNGKGWEQITSPASCANMPRGARFETCTYCGHHIAWLDEGKICYDYDPTRRIDWLHCCDGLCPTAHEDVKMCRYWAARRAFPR
jgi:hypothetical protein